MLNSSAEQLPKQTINEVIRARFQEAYELQMSGKETIDVATGLFGIGPFETIALYPVTSNEHGPNLRYVVCGLGLNIPRFVYNGIAVEYFLNKIELAPDDERQLTDLNKDDIRLASTMFVSEQGEIYNELGRLLEDEEAALHASLAGCRVSDNFAEWFEQTCL